MLRVLSAAIDFWLYLFPALSLPLSLPALFLSDSVQIHQAAGFNTAQWSLTLNYIIPHINRYTNKIYEPWEHFKAQVLVLIILTQFDAKHFLLLVSMWIIVVVLSCLGNIHTHTVCYVWFP